MENPILAWLELGAQCSVLSNSRPQWMHEKVETRVVGVGSAKYCQTPDHNGCMEKLRVQPELGVQGTVKLNHNGYVKKLGVVQSELGVQSTVKLQTTTKRYVGSQA
jgi:hypothetical protein